MASIDSQNYSPLLEKRNFKDLLEDDMVAVEEDLITKIFSQTVQVSPSDETAEVFHLQEGSTKDTEDEEDDAAAEEEEEPREYDKVPADFSHFNQTIVDLDEEGDVDVVVVKVQGEEDVPVPVESESDEIIAAAHECVEEIMEELEQLNGHINTPSTASPVDHVDDDEDQQQRQQQCEIRDFEEIERITMLVEASPEKEHQQQQQHVIDLTEEEPIIIEDTTEDEEEEEETKSVVQDPIIGAEVVDCRLNGAIDDSLENVASSNTDDAECESEVLIKH